MKGNIEVLTVLKESRKLDVGSICLVTLARVVTHQARRMDLTLHAYLSSKPLLASTSPCHSLINM